MYQSNLVKGRLDYKADFNDDQTTVFDDDNYNFESHINFIQSLYKETFVIESEEDIARIKVNAIIELANGIKLYAKEVSNSWINAPMIGSLLANSLNYISLKGATVEQLIGDSV